MQNALRVPRVVHQIWMQGAEFVPDKLRARQAAWRDYLAPPWQHRQWDEAAVVELLRQRYPDWLAWYVGIHSLMVRADAARVFVLHAHGGIYADMDATPNQPLEDFVAMVERDAAARFPGQAVAAFPRDGVFGANNYLLVSHAGAPFWMQRYLPHVKASLAEPRLADSLLSTLIISWPVLAASGPVAYARLARTQQPSAPCLAYPHAVFNSRPERAVRGASGFFTHGDGTGWFGSWRAARMRFTAVLFIWVCALVGVRCVVAHKGIHGRLSA